MIFKERIFRTVNFQLKWIKFFNTERKINSKIQKVILLVVTYYPLLKSLSRIVIMFIYYTWIKGYLLHNPWFLIEARVS